MNLLRWVVRLVEDLGERYRIGATFGAILLGGFYVAHHVGQSTRGGQAAAQLAFWFAILGSVWIAGLLHRLKKERNLREYERLEREVLQPARGCYGLRHSWRPDEA